MNKYKIKINNPNIINNKIGDKINEINLTLN